MCLDVACVRCGVFVAPGRAVKGWDRRILWVIDDSHGAFLVFSTQFGDEGEISCAVERPLNLLDKLT